MRKPFHIPFFIAILSLFSSLYFSAFRLAHHAPAEIIEKLKAQYYQDIDQFLVETQTLAASATNLQDNPTSVEALRKQFLATRDAFKRIEWLAEYYDAETVKFHLNGAPLRHMPPDDGGIIYDPEGLQILEEHIFSEDPLALTHEIQSLTQDLAEYTKEFQLFSRTPIIKHRHIFEAARLQLIRILSLSLTGFDTPITLRGIAETRITMDQLHQAIKQYYGLMDERVPTLSPKIEAKFVAAQQYLAAHQDFDQFDRLTFLVDYLNPLFAYLHDAHRGIGFPTMYESHPGYFSFSYNYSARNIFSDSLINPFHYTNQVAKQHTPAAIALGRALFFDPILSKNLERSCASCHQPEKYFTDGEVKSIASGFNGTVNRNAPTLINAAFAERFFYDLRAEKLDKQVSHVIYDEKEFNTSEFEILSRLKQSPAYTKMFQKAYPNLPKDGITSYSMTTSLASYIISLSSYSSPVDQYIKGQRADLAPAVRRGFNLFMGKAGCGTCHFAPTFSGLVPPLFQESESEVLGVPASTDTIAPEIDSDMGRLYGRMNEYFDIFEHSFKTTTVRNAGMTAPYMHNGVYETLEEVVDFYNKGGGMGLGIDVPNQTLPPDPLGLTAEEQADLVAFMEALTNVEQPHIAPENLPAFPAGSPYEHRKIGGEY